MTTPRPQWHYGNHPPACTCVSCVARRSGPRTGRQVWRGRDITPSPAPAPGRGSAPAPDPVKRSVKGAMAFLFLLGLIAGGAAVWWWGAEGPGSLGPSTETVQPVVADVGRQPSSTPTPPPPAPAPVIIPVASPTLQGDVEKSTNQPLVSTATPPTVTRPATPPHSTEAPVASPTVSPTSPSTVELTRAPTLAPMPTPAQTLVHLLSPLEIMRLVDRGKLTEEEAVAILAERKGTAKSDPSPLPTATPEVTNQVVPKVTPPSIEIVLPTAAPLVVAIAEPTFTSPEPFLSTPEAAPSSAQPSGSRPSPDQRNLEEKKYVLNLVNQERKNAGLAPVVLGNNSAAQDHAEVLLRHNTRGHWGVDGLLPQVRYTLAGGVNYVSENVSAYRLLGGLPYRKQSPEALLKKSHQGLMGSPGHRKTILDKWHTKVSLGIDCNDYGCSLVQNFAGDYVEFDQKPVISKGTLRLAGWLKGGFQLQNIQVWYHEPPHPLTVAQLEAGHAYTVGQEIATIVLPPPGPGAFYPKKTTRYSWTAPTDPYKVDPDGAATNLSPRSRTKTVPYTIADLWSTSASNFQIRANMTKIINDLGPGVYLIVIWGKNAGESKALTNYAVFVD